MKSDKVKLKTEFEFNTIFNFSLLVFNLTEPERSGASEGEGICR